MTNRIFAPVAIVATVAACFAGGPGFAADKAPVVLARCEQSLGSIAVVDGDAQGWTKYGLGSPRELIATMATQSGCFTLHNAASGGRADFLINAIAGDKEEVDQGVNIAKTAVIEGAVRSGALTAVAGNVPMVGGMLGMFGGLGGKKKTIAAGLRVIDPGSGQTLVAGSGSSTKSTISFGNAGGNWLGNVQGASSGYASSKDGQQLATAFVQAFNGIVDQGAALQSAKAAAAPAPVAPAAPGYVTAIDTQMYATAAKGPSVRALRAATSLTPTGKREGLFVEVKDSFGTQGWVSVEDLK